MKRDPKTGKVTIDPSQKLRIANKTSENLARALVRAIGTRTINVSIETVSKSKSKVSIIDEIVSIEAKLKSLRNAQEIGRERRERVSQLDCLAT